MSNKRGSLAISTNAIVVLIIAVIMLGLIIGLVTNAFGSVEDRLFEQIEANEPAAPSASNSNQITLSSTSKRADLGELSGIQVNIYNPFSTPMTSVRPYIDCGSRTVVDHEEEQVIAQTIQPGQQANYMYFFSISSSAPEGVNLCQVKVGDHGEGETDLNEYQDASENTVRATQFTIRVR